MVTFKAFLESTPPNTPTFIEAKQTPLASGTTRLSTPSLQLHCTMPVCGFVTVFACTDDYDANPRYAVNRFLDYTCKNCGVNRKIYSLRIFHDTKTNLWSATKFGEYPEFGETIPAKVLRLVQPDKDLIIKGMRCENQGLGIAAFAYYRRVIENQRNLILDELLRVIRAIEPESESISELESAKKEIQFTKSISKIRHAIPAGLLINGENPLLLLHRAMSQLLHNHSDEECLDYASATRRVLFQFAEQMSQVLKDDRELNQAVALLSNPKPKPKATGDE